MSDSLPDEAGQQLGGAGHEVESQRVVWTQEHHRLALTEHDVVLRGSSGGCVVVVANGSAGAARCWAQATPVGREVLDVQAGFLEQFATRGRFRVFVWLYASTRKAPLSGTNRCVFGAVLQQQPAFGVGQNYGGHDSLDVFHVRDPLTSNRLVSLTIEP
jgi:hypothetical protein